jgi:hypothetical protein
VTDPVSTYERASGEIEGFWNAQFLERRGSSRIETGANSSLSVATDIPEVGALISGDPSCAFHGVPGHGHPTALMSRSTSARGLSLSLSSGDTAKQAVVAQ